MWLMKWMGAAVAAGAVVAGAAALDDVQAVGEYRPGVHAIGVPADMARMRRGDAPALDADWTMFEGGEETVFAH